MFETPALECPRGNNATEPTIFAPEMPPTKFTFDNVVYAVENVMFPVIVLTGANVTPDIELELEVHDNDILPVIFIPCSCWL